jgi:hypothetical protein
VPNVIWEISLVNPLAFNRRDPFASFVFTFSPLEHFLLDHCKSPLPENQDSNAMIRLALSPDMHTVLGFSPSNPHIDLTVVIPWLNSRCGMQVLGTSDIYLECMNQDWVRLALTDAGFLQSIFLETCRHLSMAWYQRQGDFVQLASRYKIACMRTLIESISGRSSYNDATIANVIELAFDEVRLLRRRERLDQHK